MSCEQGPNKIAKWAGRISGGLSQLAGKRAFYAGLAVSGAGLVGAGLIAAARQRSQGRRPVPSMVDARQVRQLGQRAKAQPVASLASGERCAGCQTPANRKPGAWYTVNGRSYCPDCAPEAARKVDVDLVRDAGGLEGWGAEEPGSRGAGGKSFSLAPSHPRTPALNYLPAERRVSTRLMPSRVGVFAGEDRAGQARWFAVKGYVVTRSNGYDTGLAVTPALKLKNEDGAVEEDTQQWWITHIPSGKHIPGAGAYERPEEAQLLAGVLAQLDWTRSETELTTAEIRRVGATVSAFNESLAEEKLKQTKSGPQGEGTATRRLAADEPLAGKLVADGYGGVARVLEVTPDGQGLFVVDSLGERYEVARHQIRTPDEADFEGVRAAMSFDPTTQPEGQCTLCGRPTSGTGAGEMWYRMNFKTFCEGCATQYAAQEAYIMEDEIGDAPEPVR